MRKQAIGVCLAFWMCAGSAYSQNRAGFRFTGPPASGNSSHHHLARPFFAGFPYWPDYLPTSEATPSVIVVQAPPALNAPTKPEETKSSPPLMIEWQGDRYVRRSLTTENSRANQPDYIAEEKPSVQNNQRAASSRMESKHSSRTLAASDQLEDRRHRSEKAQPPTTFIFRDGHREQSSNYSIISGVIYARGDYWTTGQWSKQIRVSELDLPATIQANQAEGIQFRLPTAPNEIVTRP